jgi:hypothetical protein
MTPYGWLMTPERLTLTELIDQAEAVVRQMRADHTPAPVTCTCGESWPCETIRALDGDMAHA